MPDDEKHVFGRIILCASHMREAVMGESRYFPADNAHGHVPVTGRQPRVHQQQGRPEYAYGHDAGHAPYAPFDPYHAQPHYAPDHPALHDPAYHGAPDYAPYPPQAAPDPDYRHRAAGYGHPGQGYAPYDVAPRGHAGHGSQGRIISPCHLRVWPAVTCCPAEKCGQMPSCMRLAPSHRLRLWCRRASGHGK